MCNEQAISIFSAIKVFSKNHYRKPYIIMVASLIEQLFNDYFRMVVSRKLTGKGQNIFLDKYETAGIQSAIDIIDSFLNENFLICRDFHQGILNICVNLRNVGLILK